ncbi:MAG TPA: hypothetical protein VKX49_12820 [Bryobacteraceae bacterium]|nr:hypothetical protein [Bryobacteraceae bacterium]
MNRSNESRRKITRLAFVLAIFSAGAIPLSAQEETGRWPGGWIDYATCDQIEGWAADAHHPERQFDVEILEHGKKIGEATANLYRLDLEHNLDFGNGSYGFRAATPARLKDGRRHDIAVRIKGTHALLYGVDRSSTRVIGYEVISKGSWTMRVKCR